MPNVFIFKVDVDELDDIAANEHVNFVPQFIFYKNGEKLRGFETCIGSYPKRIREMIQMHS